VPMFFLSLLGHLKLVFIMCSFDVDVLSIAATGRLKLQSPLIAAIGHLKIILIAAHEVCETN